MSYDFTFYSDAAHGWLLVSKITFEQVGLTEADISRYSYHHKDTLALEEDCDAGVFIKAWEKAVTREPIFRETQCQGDAMVRGWQKFGTKTYRTHMTEAGEQTVMPGCELDQAPRTKQLDLF